MSLKSVEKVKKAQDFDSCFVVLNDDVVLEEDFSEFFIRGKVISNRNEDVNTFSFVFLPEDSTLTDKGLFLARAIVKVFEDFIPVKVIKPDRERIILKRGTKV